MPSTINASTSSGIVSTADTSGVLELQSNGTTKLTVASTGAYGQLVSGTAVASTSGTSIDFTGIPSWVKRVTVMFNAVSTSGTSNYLVQIGSGSVTTTGYASGSFSIDGTNSTGTSVSTSGFLVVRVVTAAATFNGLINIFNISGNSWVESGSLTNSTTTGFGTTSNGSIALAGVLDRVRITTVNGTDTFDAGSINILYEG
jgi:hypothetical protein